MALQQIKERGALPMIDRGDIRQQIDRCSNIWASLPGAGYVVSSSIRLTAWLQPQAGGTVREIDVWAESPRLSPLWLSASSFGSSAVNHYRDNAIVYKAQRDKNARELKLANAAITDMQMRQRDVAALDAKYTKELADAKAENDALRDDVGRWSPSVAHQSSRQSVRSHHRLRRGCSFPRLADTAEWMVSPLRERLITMQKQLEGTQKILSSSADRVAHIDGQLMQLLYNTIRASSGV